MIIEKEKNRLTLVDFEKITGVPFSPKLQFETQKIFADIQYRGGKLLKKGGMTREQIWFGIFFQKEILAEKPHDVSIQWIDSQLGWGVFAERPFRKMEFITEYTGVVRKRTKHDEKNPYCFEYLLAQGSPTPYIIDAMNQGGVSRYINHSDTPNLQSALATFDHVSHVILYTKKPIAKGDQLCYDYGPDYWSQRSPPKKL